MPFFHILTVSEDVLLARAGDRRELERELGRAVLAACQGATPKTTGPELIAQRDAIANKGLVRYVGEFGSEDIAVYACYDGRLQVSSELGSWPLGEVVGTVTSELERARKEGR